MVIATEETISIAKQLELNAKLQTKKNKLRKALAEKGRLGKDRENTYDKYTYFSEAGYKELFTELFSAHGLELSTTEVETIEIQGTNNMPFGRKTTLEFILTDIDTGFCETSRFSGEGMDRGDKAIYKAYTGALKYYFASTFNVATGDDPEKESPSGEKNVKRSAKKKTESQDMEHEVENEKVKPTNVKALKIRMEKKGVVDMQICKAYQVKTLEELTLGQWKSAMNRLEHTPDKKEKDLGL